MKKLFLLAAAMMLGIMLSAQTQNGYVKTKGRMVDGKLVPGQGLKGATVSVHGRTAVLVDADDGAFSFPVPEAKFRIDSVRKKGYQLVDMDALSKTYKHSANPIYLVMETPEQQMEDQIDNFNKINASQQVLINKLRAEVRQLKEQNKINEEEYSIRLLEIAQIQSESQNLVNEMAERYSKIDFDQLDEFNQQVSWFILNGELIKADSLIKSKGDMEARSAELDRIHNANAEEEAKLEQSKKYEAKALEDFATDCYSLFEICKLKYVNDSAAYWLELRASKDTTIIEWQNEAGRFIEKYFADYDKALSYFSSALRQALQQQGEQSKWAATCYNNIGVVYDNQGDYDKALEYYEKALNIRKAVLWENHPDIAQTYNNIGEVYNDQGDYGKAMKFHEKALTIRKAVLWENHPDMAQSYNNIGSVYHDQGDYDKALEYYEKALTIWKAILGENYPDVATSYNNIGSVYRKQGEYDKALEYYGKSLNILKAVLGESHPYVAMSYNNIGYAYNEQGNYGKAMEYLEKALNILKAVLGENHSNVAINYHNIGNVYNNQGDYDKALEYYEKALNIFKAALGENHPKVATNYNSIGSVYNKQGDYDKAVEYYEKALEIRISVFGEDHPLTIQTHQKISEIQAKLKEQENEQKTEE